VSTVGPMTGTAYDRMLGALEAHGSKVRMNGTGAMAQCPAHEDRDPSLSVGRADRFAGALVKCQAGCHLDDVLGAIGFTTRDLFDQPRDRSTGYAVTAEYPYTDEHGVVLFVQERRFPKDFRVKRPNGTGWTYGLGDTRRVLYRLPEVLAAVTAGKPIHVVEGERDADALVAAGHVATTGPLGAGKWRPEYGDTLAGAHVVLVADDDPAGYAHARTVAADLTGKAATVRVVKAATGKDVSDHLAAGHTLDDLVPVEVGDLVPDEPDPASNPSGLDVVNAADVELRRVHYVWDRMIPLGAMTLMPGEEGIGKTTVGIRLMADLTRGTLPGEHYGNPKDVLVLATEDGLADVFVPRLVEAGADVSRVWIVRARIREDGTAHEVIVPRDLAMIGDVVRAHGIGLVWIDSLVTTLPDDMKSISYKDVAKVMKALSSWAERERVAVVAPWHLNKSSGSDTALRIMDSRAFRTSVRSMLLVVADPDAPPGKTCGIVALDKANAGSLAVPALRYTIRSATYTVEETDELTGEIVEVPGSCGVADWAGQIDGDGRELARSYLEPRLDRDDPAGDWLREYLTDAGEAPRKDVMAAGGRAGQSVSGLQRAGARLRVHSREIAGQGADGLPYRHAMWSLPSSRPTGSQSGHGPYPTDRTDPIGESNRDLTYSISAGQRQCVQSGQSGQDHGTDPTGEPTGEQGPEPVAACTRCGQTLLLIQPGRDTCGRCDPTPIRGPS